MKGVQSMWSDQWRRTAWMAGVSLLAVSVVALLFVILPPPATATRGSLSEPIPRVSRDHSVPGDKIYAPGDLAYVTLSNNNLVALVDTAAHSVVGTVDVGAAGCSFPWRAAMTPTGDQVWVACDSSGSIAVIDTTTNSVVHTVTGIPYADGIALTRDGAYALVGSRYYAQIAIVNTNNYLPSYLSTPAVPRSVATHPFLDRAYATGTDGTLRVIDLTTFAIVATIPVGGDPWDAAVSTDGRWVFAGDRWGSGLVVVDANTDTVHTTITGLGDLTGLEVAPDGSQIYACSLYEGVRIVDGASFGLLDTVDTSGESWAAAVTCDGSKLFVGDTNDLVPVIDTAAHSLIENIAMPGWGARGIAICPQYVVSGVVLSPPTQTNSGAPGEVVAHQETLINVTGATGSFDLVLGSHTWDTALSTGSLGPIADGDSITFTVYVTVPAGVDWYTTDTVVVTATSVASPTVYTATADFTTQAYAPPRVSVSPEVLVSTQYVNEIATQPLTINNGNGVTLTFDLVTGSGASSSLEGILSTLNSNYQQVIDAIPNRYDFDEGETGFYISDGGNDMYDYGNVLSTNYGGSIEYSNNQILDSAYFGDSGRYFTRKYPGLFLLVADMKDVDSFEISGDLGADGSGNADGTILQAQLYGVTYYGFVKRVYNAYDPSVNHLIIVADNPAADHAYATDTNDDYHEVYNLAPSTRLYYLLYAGSSGYYIDDTATLQIMLTFLDALDLLLPAPWLSADPASGEVPASASVEVQVAFDATAMQPDEYRGALVVQSNDPLTPSVSVPATMTVLPTANMGWVEGTVTDAGTGAPLEATLIALGQPYAVTTDPATGAYIFWLEEGSYTLQAAAGGYVTETAAVNVVAQQGATQDFELVLNVPVLQVSPGSLHVTHEVGDVGTQWMTVANAGPADLTFELAERDTTPGLAQLQAYARTDQELAEMTAQAASLDDPHNEGLPATARFPAGAFLHLQGATRILAWTGYTDYYQEYQNTLNGIAQYTSFSLVESNETDPAMLAALLADADVLLLPEQEYADWLTLYNLGAAWADVLDDFVVGGGTIVAMDRGDQTTGLVAGAGLMDVVHYGSGDGIDVEVVAPDHPLAQDLPPTFIGASGTGLYSTADGQEIVRSIFYGLTVVAAKDIGVGHVVLIGFDFYSYNDDMARLLANAVLWHGGDVPWLSEEPVSGTVPGYSSLPVAVTFDATGMQPGDFAAGIIVDSNDPIAPPVVMPVTMTVLPSGDMGHVTGTVYDAWTGLPLTATVELVGVYSATARPDFQIWAPAGTYSLRAYTSGYYTETIPITIVAGETIVQDLGVEPALPRIEWHPAAVAAVAAPGTQATRSLLISNVGPLPLEITLHETSPTHALRAPSQQDLAGKQILFDRAHGEPDMWSYSILVGDAIAAGAVVTQNWTYPIDASVLEGYDVLWVNCCGGTGWTFGELTAVDDWLAGGGAVLVQGESSPSTTGPAGILGIGYQPGACTSGTTTNITDHPISEGVAAVYIDWTCSWLSASSAANVVVFDPQGQPHVVAQAQDGGKMVVVANENFYDGYIDYEDNRLLANNILAWLARPGYSDVAWLSETPDAATIPGHSTLEVTLVFDARTLALGNYEAIIAIEHTDPGRSSPVEVPVTLSVGSHWVFLPLVVRSGN